METRRDISRHEQQTKRKLLLRRLNKGPSSKFVESYPDGQAPGEDRKSQLPERCDNHNKDEDIQILCLDKKERQNKTNVLATF